MSGSNECSHLVQRIQGVLRTPSAILTSTGIDFQDKPTLEECKEILRVAGFIDGGCAWWRGDVLNEAGKHYGETYGELQAITGKDDGTLKNEKYVSSQIEKSRRRYFLSWGHHQAVAPLTESEQDYWLDCAEPEPGKTKPKLTRSELRRLIRESKQLPERFEICAETQRIMDWLQKQRAAWPEQLQQEFLPIIQNIVARIEDMDRVMRGERTSRSEACFGVVDGESNPGDEEFCREAN